MVEKKFKILERINDVDIISCISEGEKLRCEIHSKIRDKHKLIKKDLKIERLSVSTDVNFSQERSGRTTILPSKDNNLKCLRYPDELDCYEEKGEKKEDVLSPESIKKVTGEVLRALPQERK